VCLAVPGRARPPGARYRRLMSCPECGFGCESLAPEAVPGRLRALRSKFSEELAGAGAAAARRPEPAVWSALEYTCHVRDVLLVQRERAIAAQVEDIPAPPRMHRDERVALARYDAHPVPVVLDQLGMAAELCAVVFEALGQAGWARRLVYSYPAATERDLAWVGRNTVHEGEHHLVDVRRVLAVQAVPDGQVQQPELDRFTGARRAGGAGRAGPGWRPPQ
jgi:DNA segregation ATPase FtsK/SpoIIIE, S-DNA-T family